MDMNINETRNDQTIIQLDDRGILLQIRNGNNTALVNGKVNMVEASVQENGSAGQSAAEEAGITNIIATQDQAAALMEVAAGTSDACVIDITMANAMTGEGTSYADLTSGISLTSEEYGGAFRKESDLTAKFNEFMDKIAADGTLQALADKYSLTLAG